MWPQHQSRRRYSRDELAVVVAVARVDVLAAVLEEVVHRRVGVVLHQDLVAVGPDLYPDQSHIDVELPVQLRQRNSCQHVSSKEHNLSGV